MKWIYFFIAIILFPKLSIGLDISGFTSFGISADEANTYFLLNATEIGFNWKFDKKYSLDAVVVLEPEGETGIEPSLTIYNCIAKDINLVLGFFDVPIGIESTYWDPQDNPFNSLSIIQNKILNEYGDVGIKFNIEKKYYDIDLYVVNGIGSSLIKDNDKAKSLGIFFNFKPIQNIKIGFSGNDNIINRNFIPEEYFLGAHIELLFNKINFISEAIRHNINNKNSDAIYALLSYSIFKYLDISIRSEKYFSNSESHTFATSIKFNDNIKLKIDYKYLNENNIKSNTANAFIVVSF